MPSILNYMKRKFPVETEPDIPCTEIYEQIDQGEEGRGGDNTDGDVSSVPTLNNELQVDNNDINNASDSSSSINNLRPENMSITCRECGRAVKLVLYDGDTSATSPDTGAWYRFTCSCGFAAFICQRDYNNWAYRTGVPLHNDLITSHCDNRCR